MKKDLQYEWAIIELLEKAEKFKIAGDFKKSIDCLETVLVFEPKCFEAFEEIGDNYISLRKLKEAKKALEQAIKISPESANAHYLLGFLFSLEQKWKKSVEELTKADKFFPNHPEILRCLGWSMYNQNRKSQGIAVLERSRNLAPTDTNILCDLGVCHMSSANFSEAEAAFLEVVRIDPKSEQAQESLEFLRILNEERSKL